MPEKEEKEELVEKVDRGKRSDTIKCEGGEEKVAGESHSASAAGGEERDAAKESRGRHTFGVKSYLHQFYSPQPVENPGIYEFPQVNMGTFDAADAKQRKLSYGKVFTVTVIGGALLSLISGVLLSFQYYAPYIWLQMTDKFPGIEMWMLSGFLGGLLVIITAILIELLLMSGCQSHNENGSIGANENKDVFQTPGPQGNIPIIQEIQAIQPPQESIMSSMQ